MSRFAYQFVSGNAFFAGLLLVCAAMICRLWATGAFARSVTTVVMSAGVVFVVFSGTPFPAWVYIAWGVSLLAVFVGGDIPNRTRLLLVLSLAVSLSMAAWELPYHFAPKLPVAGCDTLFVVGDSLSMGADPPGKNWPELLGEKLALPTKNYSFGGAKVGSALSNAERIDRDTALVILEIGGNDMFAGTPAFDADLDRILATACKGQRRVAMLELPVPPFLNRFGRAQRRLARVYGVTLIPKRYLATVLATPGATVDGLHLSNKGHVLLADALFGLRD